MELIAGLVVAAPFVLVGWWRYRRHRRALTKLFDERTTSRKVRVEREP